MGPLSGLKIVEMAGIGPAPFAGMLLSDMGADVVRIDRKATAKGDAFDRLKSGGFLDRGRRSDRARSQEAGGRRGRARTDRRRGRADRGLSPRRDGAPGPWPGRLPRAQSQARLRPRHRMGPGGPLAKTVGHDIDYIALTGALHAIGEKDAPAPPLNLLGDFGGGAMALAFGVVCALLEARELRARPDRRRGDDRRRQPADGDDLQPQGEGPLARRAAGQPARRRRAVLRRLSLRRRQMARRRRVGAAVLRRARRRDGARRARFRRPLEPRVLAGAARASGRSLRAANARRMGARSSRERTPASRRSSTWTRRRAIPTMSRARPSSFVDGAPQPAPAPRFSRTKPEIARPPAALGEHGEEILRERGFTAERIDALKRAGAL